MNKYIDEYIGYIENVKKYSKYTIINYRDDLEKFDKYNPYAINVN